MIRFKCFNCKKILKAPDGSTGRTAKCPKCKNTVTVPPEYISVDRSKTLFYCMITFMLLWLTCLVIVSGLIVGFALNKTNKATPVSVKNARAETPIVKTTMEEGDELYELGRKTEAITKYKAAYPTAGERKSQIITRIIEQSLRDRNLSEYMNWCNRAVEDNLEPELTGDAKDMLEHLKSEKAKKRVDIEQLPE